MKYKEYLLFCLVLTLFSCADKKPSKEANELFAEVGVDSTQAALIFNKAIDLPNKTQVSIALVTDSATYFVGVICRNDTILSINNKDTHFEIGSISTMMTATLLSNFVNKGKLSLTDSISSFLPFQLKDSIEITFGQLANHTSGLPKVPTGMLISSLLNMDNPYKNFDENALKNYLTEDIELSSKPGESVSSSNLGYGVLGFTLSIVGEQPIGELLKEHVFVPYKLNNTTVYRDSVKGSLIQGMNAEGRPTANWDMASMAGAGAVLSTAEDLALFAKAHCDSTDKVLSLTREFNQAENETGTFSLSWKVLKENGEQIWFMQNGTTGGYTSALVINPSACNGVVVLSNVSGANGNSERINELCLHLMETLNK